MPVKKQKRLKKKSGSTPSAGKLRHCGRTLDEKDGYRVIECETCAFTHVSPLISEAELRKFYEKEFYASEKPNYFKDMRNDREWWEATYENYYALMEAHTPGRRLLDVGCGPGLFMKGGIRRGWEVVGVEPAPEAAEFVRKQWKAEVLNDFFDAERARNLGTFDALSLLLVLEHVSDPAGMLREARKMLKQRGLVLIVSPNDYNPLQEVLRNERGFDPWWVVPKHHLNHFNFKSIKSLLSRTGFSVVETLATFPMEYYLLAGENYVGNPTIGRRVHARRKRFEMPLYRANPELLNGLYRDFAKRGIGRSFVLVAQKN